MNKSQFKFLSIFFAICGLLLSHIVDAANVKVTATLDSAYLLMGKQTVLHLEIIQDISQRGKLLNEPKRSDSIIYLSKGIEFNDIVRNDTTNISDSRLQVNKDYLIQSFDSGLYTIPPFKYVVGIDTFKTNSLTLKVIPIPIDSVYNSIYDYAPIEEIERKWYDFIPDSIFDNWIWFIVVFVLIGGLIAIIYLLKNKKNIILSQKKFIPPHELAIQQLQILKGEKLWENGREKEYYTRITEILREYMAGRFGILAMEMTSSQIIESINNNEEIKTEKKELFKVLEMADFVKFAKVKPLPDDNIKTFNIALQFIENTKPIIEENSSEE